MDDKVNIEMITLARDSRGVSQSELSRLIGISQSTLSKYESGILDVSEEHLAQIAIVLDYPKSFFFRNQRVYGCGSGCMYHRKRKTISVIAQRRIEATVIRKRMEIEELLKSVEIDNPKKFVRFDFPQNSPQEIAALLRRTWGLPPGPIRNLVAVIEDAGGVVVPFSFGTGKLDAISQWKTNMPPVFYINSDMPWDRIRFSLAHEIGHLVMHEYASGSEQEREADDFASSFLMPAQDIKNDLFEISLKRAAHLKPYWRVSMQALIVRAHKLRVITDSQYRRLFTLLSKLGYRKKEPIEVSSEWPSTLKNLIEVHTKELNYSELELQKIVCLNASDFYPAYWPHAIRIVK